jgi:hypothetical protein
MNPTTKDFKTVFIAPLSSMIYMNMPFMITGEFNKFGKCYQVPLNVMIVLKAKQYITCHHTGSAFLPDTARHISSYINQGNSNLFSVF